jgi:inorganic pyrophosphatase
MHTIVTIVIWYILTLTFLIQHIRGDNDPVDVCEIGARIVKTGVSHYNQAFTSILIKLMY